MEKADVVIVGGGIAGLSVASFLCSRTQLKIALVEKEKIGSNQTTPVVFMDTIREFGLEDSILENYTGFIHHSPLGAYARFNFGRKAMAALDYQKICAILYERASKKGLYLINAQALDWHPHSFNPDVPLTLRLDNHNQINAQLLIDASGHRQWAATLLGIKRSDYYSHCFGEYLKGCVSDENALFRFLGPTQGYGNGGGWWYPVGPDCVSAGYSVVTSSSAPHNKAAAAGYAAAKEGFRPYSDWMKQAEKVKAEYGIVPVGRIGRFFSDRLLIVGDAAGQAHPWVVEGCRPALENAGLCAEVVEQAFLKKRFDKKLLSAYEKKWNKSNKERFFRAASVAELAWNRSDQEWDKLIASLGRLSAEQLLCMMRDNHASAFHRWYAVAGYIRRKLAKKLKRQKREGGEA